MGASILGMGTEKRAVSEGAASAQWTVPRTKDLAPHPSGGLHGWQDGPVGKRSKVESGTALLLYAAASIALFGAPILFQLPRWYVGWGADPASHVWFLAWWPHAIAKGMNPFVTHLALALVGQFLVSTEVFLTMTLFGGAAILLAWAFVPARRTALVRATALIGVAYVAAAVPLAPYLYYAARTAAHSPVYSFYP